MLTTYFSKKIREETSVSNDSRSTITEVEAVSRTSQEEILEIPSSQNEDNNNLPSCWNAKQLKELKIKYDGLFVSNQKLGCEYCLKIESKLISQEWKKCNVTTSEKDKIVQQASLRKKMSEHFVSKAHKLAVEHAKILKKQTFTACIDKMNEKFISPTTTIFNTLYSLAKRNRPFSNKESVIELQVKNELDIGTGLHSRHSAKLNGISQELSLDIIKIERVLRPRWASCSPRSALAVWRSYPALYMLFSSNQKMSGMAKRLQNKCFLVDLALMIDILQECSLLSNALQARNINVAKGDQLIRRTINAFQMLKDRRGHYEKKSG
nr:E3 SUMO-protein ligase KIAA1586-like [Hydra vulgaris]